MSDKLHPTELELHKALCNFCNQAGDPFEPTSKWDEHVNRSFKRLCAAYNEWHGHLIETGRNPFAHIKDEPIR
jgi:hypothetical protein